MPVAKAAWIRYRIFIFNDLLSQLSCRYWNFGVAGFLGVFALPWYDMDGQIEKVLRSPQIAFTGSALAFPIFSISKDKESIDFENESTPLLNESMPLFRFSALSFFTNESILSLLV